VLPVHLRPKIAVVKIVIICETSNGRTTIRAAVIVRTRLIETEYYPGYNLQYNNGAPATSLIVKVVFSLLGGAVIRTKIYHLPGYGDTHAESSPMPGVA